MAVYLISAVGTEFVKIGTSNNPRHRMSDLQAATFHELRLLRTWDGDRSVELWLQQRYADRHERHEWYRFCQEMMTIEPGDYVDLARLGVKFEQVRDRLIVMLNERQDLTYLEIADALNVPRTRIGNWVGLLQRLGLVLTRNGRSAA